ncbi:MAG: hypothetical protein ACI90V_005897, partial [Bacillariaceae sp.]
VDYEGGGGELLSPLLSRQGPTLTKNFLDTLD